MKDLPDFYAVLGLAPTASQDRIGHAYRALLRRYHPDTRTPGDPTHEAMWDCALQQVLAAYAVLGDPDRRADYDRQVRASSRPAPLPTLRMTFSDYPDPDRPPIVVGPVRWHRPLRRR